MKIYYDDAGYILYTLSGDLSPPGTFIEVPDQPMADYQGWKVIDGGLVQVSIEPLKNEARGRLASAIAAARTALITDLPGQDMIYLAKEAEARAWFADPAPNPAHYPLLSAEVGITAPDVASLVQIWLNMADFWRAAAAQLEAMRMSIGTAIDDAETPEEVAAALAAITL